MTRDEITLVQNSFAMLAPITGQVAEIFYIRLFKLDPSLKPLFKGDIRQQGRLLMKMLGTAVGNLHQVEAIVPAVRALGQRHVGYGVQPAHYATVGTALLATLQASLGTAFTPETRAAWTTVYTLVADQMQVREESV